MKNLLDIVESADFWNRIFKTTRKVIKTGGIGGGRRLTFGGGWHKMSISHLDTTRQ